MNDQARCRPPSCATYRLFEWLLIICAMVWVTVIIGGLTRLTHSGLSMVDWRPVTGWLPPLNDDEWARIFALYRETPQYLKINYGMSVEEFKGIFWLEYIHRVWGRIIGLAFLLPGVWFWMRGYLTRRHVLPLLGFFLLGAAQGVLGWFMVKSGLVDHPDVSPLRLSAHLGLAVFLFGSMLFYALYLRDGERANNKQWGGLVVYPHFSRWVIVTAVVVFITILSGALVAGVNGGMIYNTFPLMDGALIPDALYGDGVSSFYTHIMTVQFHHRYLAKGVLVLVGVLWLVKGREEQCHSADGTPPLLQRQQLNQALIGVSVLALVQAGLGIATLLLVVPMGVAVVHQAVGVLLMGAVVILLYRTLSYSYCDEPSRMLT